MRAAQAMLGGRCSPPPDTHKARLVVACCLSVHEKVVRRWLDPRHHTASTLTDADLTGTKLIGVDDLTAEQVQSVKNWRATHLPDSLKYLLTEPLVPPV